MTLPPVSYKRHRFPPQIIAHAVWLFFRFPLGLRLVEEMLLERRIIVSYETVRRYAMKFGVACADRLPAADHDGSLEGRDPCIPDFILRSARAEGETVIVETMGYGDEAYRLRKARMHEIMSAALEGAPVVLREMSGGRSERNAIAIGRFSVGQWD